MTEQQDLELPNVTILTVATFDDEIQYGFNNLWIAVKRSPPSPVYERPKMWCVITESE